MLLRKKKIAKKIFAATISLCSLSFGTALGQDDKVTELQRIEAEKQARELRAQTLEKNADKAAKEIAELQDKLVKAAMEREQAEKNLEQKERSLVLLREEEQRASKKFAQRRSDLESVVLALVAFEKDRPPAITVSPQNITEAARAAILMRIIAPLLNARAQEISNDISRIQRLRENILMSNDEYRNANTKLENAKKTVGVLITQKQALETRLRKDAKAERDAIAQLAQRSNNLHDLVGKLGIAFGNNNTQFTAPNAGGFAAQQGKLIYPVNGEVVQKYGEGNNQGERMNGVNIKARAGSQIIAPYDGKIEFAAPFRSYGKLIILNVGDNYRIVLGGIGASYVDIGQEVLAGEPLGEMTKNSGDNNILYMEIRNGETTIDPLLWLINNSGK